MLRSRLNVRVIHSRCAAFLAKEFCTSASIISSRKHTPVCVRQLPPPPSFCHLPSSLQCCHLSLGTPPGSSNTDNAPKDGVMVRFKKAYKEYGKTLVCVHVATSIVWFSVFYVAVSRGIDVPALMQRVGAPDSVLRAFSAPALGDAAVTYLLYKLATPLRYGVTLFGTHRTVKYLRRIGYLPPPQPRDSIRQLMRDGGAEMRGKVAQGVKDRTDSLKEGVRNRKENIKEGMRDKADSLKEGMKDKADSLKEGMRQRTDNLKGELKASVKDKLGGRRRTE